MSKIVYVVFKDPSRCNSGIESKIETISQRITPDNITPRPPKIVIDGNVVYGIVNPAESIEEKGKSVLLGMAYGDHEKWWEPGETIPDGSFSILRTNEARTEIITDVVGSRSVWYYHDNEVFIASSSQRAIVMLLGSFVPNSEVIPWVLSSGSLGPFFSWDCRIKLLPTDSSVTLDHGSWKCALNCNPVKFSSVNVPDKEHENNIMTALTDTFKSLNLDFSKWVLPLSGGYDSRGMLSLFHIIGTSLKRFKSITWGLEKAINEPGNDAYIAKKLADHFKIEHHYYSTDLSTEPISGVFKRFLVCGEGRIDHIGGYMDGFKIWKTLYEDQIQGIIRGDEGFGRLPVNSPSNVRSHIEISLCSDLSNLKGFNELGISKQMMPQNFERKENETLETWRDRLYHQYRMPVVLAALTDLKLPFVEVISPLLSRRIINQARSLPDHLRTDKLLFKKIVRSLSPKIGFATSSAIADSTFLLKSKTVVDLIKSEMLTENCKSIFPQKFITYLLENLIVIESSVNRKMVMKSFLKRFLPYSLITKASKLTAGKGVGVNTLAFRTYMICKMNEILKDDATVLAGQNFAGYL